MLLKCSKIVQSTLLQSNFVCKQTQIMRSHLLNTLRHQTIPSNLKKSKQAIATLHNVRLKFQRKRFTSNLVMLLVLNSLKNIPEFLKSHSTKIVQNCVQNCEYVLAHRLRRSQQMVSLYVKLWDKMTLQHLVNVLISQFKRRRDQTFFCLGAGLFYNWNKERIPDEDILR